MSRVFYHNKNFTVKESFSMKKRSVSLLFALLMAVCLSACSGDGDKNPTPSKGSGGSLVNEEETFTAADAYDLYSEAIVRLMEAEAYDMSLVADIDMGDTSLNVTMDNQFSDDGETCLYYSRQDLAGMMTSETFYGDGLLTEIQKGMLMGGATVNQTETERETFLTENNTAANLGGIDIPAEDFEGADIEVADGRVTVTVLYRDITSVPAELETYVNLLVDTESATDLTYKDSAIRLCMTEDGVLETLEILSGLSYTDGNDNPVEILLDATLTVNAMGEDVAVKPFTEDLLPDESEITDGEVNIGDLLGGLGGTGNFGGGSFEIPDEYKDLIPDEYLDYLQ